MPTDKTDKEPAVVDTAVLTPEQKIKELTEQVASLQAANEALAKETGEQIESLKQKLKKKEPAAPAAPEGNYAVFEGQTYKITGDFRADSTYSEVKKGHCHEGVTLLAIERPH